MSYKVSFPQAQVLYRNFENAKETTDLCKSHQKVIEAVANYFAFKEMSIQDIQANVYEILYHKGQSISNKDYDTFPTKVSNVLLTIAKIQLNNDYEANAGRAIEDFLESALSQLPGYAKL